MNTKSLGFTYIIIINLRKKRLWELVGEQGGGGCDGVQHVMNTF